MYEGHKGTSFLLHHILTASLYYGTAGRGRQAYILHPVDGCPIQKAEGVRNLQYQITRRNWQMAGAAAGYGGYGLFGGYTRWAIVFLIIFVLFFLLVPGYVAGYTGC
jgi:hypothetical protein